MTAESGLGVPPGAFAVIKSIPYPACMALACSSDKLLLDDVVRFAGDFESFRGS